MESKEIIIKKPKGLTITLRRVDVGLGYRSPTTFQYKIESDNFKPDYTQNDGFLCRGTYIEKHWQTKEPMIETWVNNKTLYIKLDKTAHQAVKVEIKKETDRLNVIIEKEANELLSGKKIEFWLSESQAPIWLPKSDFDFDLTNEIYNRAVNKIAQENGSTKEYTGIQEKIKNRVLGKDRNIVPFSLTIREIFGKMVVEDIKKEKKEKEATEKQAKEYEEKKEKELLIYSDDSRKIISSNTNLFLHSLAICYSQEKDYIEIYTPNNYGGNRFGNTTYKIKEVLKESGYKYNGKKKVWWVPFSKENFQKTVNFVQKYDTKKTPGELGLCRCWECGCYVPYSQLDENGYCGC